MAPSATLARFSCLLLGTLAGTLVACGGDGPASIRGTEDVAAELVPLPDAADGTGTEGEIERCEPPVPYASHALLDITVPGSDELLNLADPCVIKVDGTWWLYATEPGAGFTAWASTDLETWEDRGAAWLPTPGSWNERGQAWAPHVHVAEDGYYLYYTADLQIGVARADSPEGPFEEVYDHPLVGGGYGGIGDGIFEYRDTSTPTFDFEEFSIDAFVLAASDGSLTLYATCYTPLSNIIAMPMADLVTVVPKEMVVVIEPEPSGWELLVTEAPWVNEVDGRFLLTYSGNGADRPEYALGAAVADSPLGPFEKTAQSPFLKADFDNGFYGPGHHSIVQGFCRDLLLFYHPKVSPEQSYDRRLRYAPVSFDGTDVNLPPLP